MDTTKLQSEDFKEQVSNISPSHPSEATGMRRDNESIDDFEHLEPESSPVKEFQGPGTQNKMDSLSNLEPEIVSEIGHVASSVGQNTSDFSFLPASKLESAADAKNIPEFGDGKFNLSSDTLIDSSKPLIGGDDVIKSSELPEQLLPKETQDLLLGLSTGSASKPEADQLISTGEKLVSKFDSEFDASKLDNQKALSQAFMDTEREEALSSHADIPGKFTAEVDFLKSEIKSDVPESDFGNLPTEPNPSDDQTSSSSQDIGKYHDNFQDSDSVLIPSKSDLRLKEKFSDEIGSSKSSLSVQDDDDDLPFHEEKSQEEPELEVKPTSVIAEPLVKLLPSAPEPVKPVAAVSEPGLKPETVPVAEPNIKPVPSAKPTPTESTVKSNIEDDEEIKPIQLFHSMGLDAWFKPDRLHPKVVELVYWRDPKKSGIVFGSVLGVLLSLSYFSLISVVAYLSLALLTGTISFRIYKNVLQAVQKTSDGHPFKDILELDLTLPQDKVREVTDIAVAHVNAAALELRRLFLVEDLVDSIKFGVLLWCLTYVGSWFNGMTLIIIAFVALFTLPKVYENNKAQIDQNLDLVRSKIADITSKVKAAIPIGKKPVEEEKKDQ
ncbi:reticulon-1-like [Periplaneta americana]|uniref:reticulon-1-like n=1 Tax=Periplaneta americana TaxID=6978 RepID=UPI0037E7E551